MYNDDSMSKRNEFLQMNLLDFWGIRARSDFNTLCYDVYAVLKFLIKDNPTL